MDLKETTVFDCGAHVGDAQWYDAALEDLCVLASKTCG